MLSCDFYHKLRQLNPKLWVDEDSVQCCYHPDFKTAGLYIGEDRFLSVVPKNYVPEYTIEEVNSQRILAPGWRQILSSLCKAKIIDKHKAEKVFNTYIDIKPNQAFPKRYLDFNFEAG